MKSVQYIWQVLGVIVLASTASADIRYRLHAREGSLVDPRTLDGKIHTCKDPAVEDLLWKLLAQLPPPVVTVYANQDVDIDLGHGKQRADDHHARTTGKIVAYWQLGDRDRLGVTILERETLPPRVEFAILHEDQDDWCGVKWSGLGDKF